MSRKGRETTKEERALIILLHEQNKSLSMISRIVKRPKSTVQGIISRFGKRNSTENMKRTGRPRKYGDYEFITANGNMQLYKHYSAREESNMELHEFLTTSLEEGTFKENDTMWISEGVQSEDSSYSELHSSDPLTSQIGSKHDGTSSQHKDFIPGTSSVNLYGSSTTNFTSLQSTPEAVVASLPLPQILSSSTVQSSSQPMSLLQQNNRSEKIPLTGGVVSYEIKNKRSKFDEELEEANRFDGAFESSEDTFKKLILLSDRDDKFDNFGRYVATLLRCLPISRAVELQKQVINLILGSDINPETTLTMNMNSPVASSLSDNSSPSTVTSKEVEMSPPPPTKILAHTESTMPSAKKTSCQSLPLLDKNNSQVEQPRERLMPSSGKLSLPLPQKNNGREKKPSTDGAGIESSKLGDKQSEFDNELLETNQIYAALKRLEEISDKFENLSGRDDSFDSFGRYVSSLLRCLPTQKAVELQKVTVNLILESYVGLLPSKD